MEALLLLIMGATNVICFVLGARVGQKVVRGEPVELPTINPAEIIQQKRERREAQEEQDKVSVILQNAERYDGTSNGQKDVPR